MDYDLDGVPYEEDDAPYQDCTSLLSLDGDFDPRSAYGSAQSGAPASLDFLVGTTSASHAYQSSPISLGQSAPGYTSGSAPFMGGPGYKSNSAVITDNHGWSSNGVTLCSHLRTVSESVEENGVFDRMERSHNGRHASG